MNIYNTQLIIKINFSCIPIYIMYYLKRESLPRKIWKFFTNHSIYSFLFIIIAIIFLVSIYTSAIFNIIHNFRDIQSYSSLIFTVLILVDAIPLFFFILDAIFSENEFQLALVLLIAVITSIISFLSVTKSVIANINEIGVEYTIHRVLMITTCIIGVISIILFLLLSIPLSRSFGWKIFHKVGTRPDYIKRYKVFLWWDTVARADIFAVITVIFLSVAFNGIKLMTWPTTILLPLLVIASILAYIIVKRVGIYREKLGIVLLYILFSMIFPIYLSFKIVMIATHGLNNYGIPEWFEFSDWTIDTQLTFISATVTVVISFILRIILCILSVLVMMNFNQGMKSVFLNKEGSGTFTLLS